MAKSKLFLGVSVLPALMVMPAMAGVEKAIWNPKISEYTFVADEVLPDVDTVEYAELYSLRSPIDSFELDGAGFSLDANSWAGTYVGHEYNLYMHDFATVENFVKTKSGGAVVATSGASMTIDKVKFFNNFAVGGGAISIVAALAEDGGKSSEVDISNSVFLNNSSKNSGGAISNSASVLSLSNVEFLGNTAVISSAGNGGAIDNSTGQIKISNGALFKENKANQNGGAIFSGDVLVQGDVVFEGNQAMNAGAVHVGTESFVVTKDLEENDNTVSFKKNVATGNAGALFANKSGVIDITATNIEFIENSGGDNGGNIYIQDAVLKLLGQKNTFYKNHSTKVADNYKKGGGAIHNQINSIGSTIIVGANENSLNLFSENTALTHGGAILNRGDGNGHISNMTLNGLTSFVANEAMVNGGALYQYVKSKDIMNVVVNGDVEFVGNIAGGNGGAIFNEKEDGAASNIMLNGFAVFSDNNANVGGALYNKGVLGLQTASFKNNTANGYYGGAVYNSGAGSITNLVANFDTNKVVNEYYAIGGAVANIGRIDVVNGKFYGNEVIATYEGSSSKGGAIYTYAGSLIESVVADFSENKAIGADEAIGGAVVNDGTIEKLSQINDGFLGNVSVGAVDGWAGALYNSETGLIKELMADFANNCVTGGKWAVGGAIVNKGQIESLSGNFVNNYTVATAENALALGGAIYNETDAVVNITKNTVFSGNTAGGVANDIYNDGIVNFMGDTLLDGGINGSGMLTVGTGATLNIGSASIEQGKMILDGTLIATLRDGDSQLNVYDEFIGNGSLKLSFGGVGTYHVFGGQAFDNVDVSSSVYDLNWSDDNKDLIVSVKSAESIAADNGVSVDAASLVAGLTGSSSVLLNDLSIKMQENLATGDVKVVEGVANAINPEKASVVQSTVVSLQNTVSSLASSRMSGTSMGRNGGDVVLTSGTVWAQGLYNKSKMDDQFDGKTRGMTFGVDGMFNDNIMIGAGYAFSHSDIVLSSRDTEIDSHSVFAYGQYKPSEWYVNALVNYTLADYTESGETLGLSIVSDYKTSAFGAQLMTGYDFLTGVTPEFGLRYLRVNGANYTNSLNIKNELNSADYLIAVFGTKYGFDVIANDNVLFHPELRAAVKYDLVSDKSSVTVAMPGVAAYTLNGDSLARLGAEFGISLTMKYQGLDVSLIYDIDVREDYTSQTGMLKLRMQF